MERKHNQVTLILTVFLLILKLKIFTKTLLTMLKDGLIHLTVMRKMKDCFQQVKQNVIGLFNDELGGKIMTEFIALRAKTYAYLINSCNDDDYCKNKIINKKGKGI